MIRQTAIEPLERSALFLGVVVAIVDLGHIDEAYEAYEACGGASDIVRREGRQPKMLSPIPNSL
jgi:hypothetical protein